MPRISYYENYYIMCVKFIIDAKSILVFKSKSNEFLEKQALQLLTTLRQSNYIDMHTYYISRYIFLFPFFQSKRRVGDKS